MSKSVGELSEFECSWEPDLVLGILLNLKTMMLLPLVHILQGWEYIGKWERMKEVTARGWEGPERNKSTL